MESGDLYDLRRLFHFREILEGLDSDDAPQAVVLDGASHLGSGPVGILSGSFNPPTLAHMELARRARESFQLGRVYFTISRVTIDKEQVEGLSQEDRMLLLSLITGELGWASLAAVNKGLYFEQARAFRSLLGNEVKIYFIVGMDKVIQIFDAGYYQDRDKALNDLFTEIHLIAAARGAWGEQELRRLLARAENRAYQNRVHSLTFPAEMRELSSSGLRTRIANNESVQGQLPEEVERFVAATGAYRPTYDARSRLLDLLYGVKEWADTECDFKALIRIAGENTERGEKLRGVPGSDKISPSQLKEFISGLLKS